MPSSNVSWPVPLQRLTPWYPGQMGVPGTDSDRGLRLDSNGKIVWVDPNHVDANDQKDGTDPESPMRTVGAALTKCRPYSGDVIAVMNNSDWTYGNLGVGRATPIREAVIVTTPGIRIIGVAPSGSLGAPWMSPLSNTTCITVRAMDTLIEGFNFWTTGTTGTVAISAQWEDALGYYGENLTVRHCHFYAIGYAILLDYTYNCWIENNYFNAPASGAIHNPGSSPKDPEYCVIRNNIFIKCPVGVSMHGADMMVYSNNVFQDCDSAISAQEANSCSVFGNIIKGDPTSALNYIDFTTNATNGGNMVADNWLGCTLAQYAVTCADGSGDFWVRNHCRDGETAANP